MDVVEHGLRQLRGTARGVVQARHQASVAVLVTLRVDRIGHAVGIAQQNLARRQISVQAGVLNVFLHATGRTATPGQ